LEGLVKRDVLYWQAMRFVCVLDVVFGWSGCVELYVTVWTLHSPLPSFVHLLHIIAVLRIYLN
jgi:hypothetical protein